MSGVVDLHCHTYHSDGVLGPAEFFRRAEVAGVEGVALTDHVDASNIERTAMLARGDDGVPATVIERLGLR